MVGKYLHLTGSDSSMDCIDCVGGTYVSTAGSDEAADCLVCPAGQYSEAVGQDSVDDCIVCGVGKYLDFGEGATLTQRSTGDSNSGPGVRATIGGPDYATVGYDTAGDGAHDTAGASLQVFAPGRGQPRVLATTNQAV